jgi:nitrogen fixation protein NifB
VTQSPFPPVSAVMREHPCFDSEAHERIGRVHLPVAPRCNIHCRFCERVICAAQCGQHPGWARKLLTPSEAIELVRGLVRAHRAEPFVVGVAGPGEPLANDATFAVLRQVHKEFPSLQKCVSTNGLLLEQSLPELLKAGVRALTVTVNAPDGSVGQHVYAWVKHDGRTLREVEAADLLIARQMRGIEMALHAGLAVKVNSVLIPSVNDQHMMCLARRLASLGVHLMNIMPLIPGGAMAHCRAPTREELQLARSSCRQVIQQFDKCQQCSADVVCFPGPRAPSCFSPAPPTHGCPRVG